MNTMHILKNTFYYNEMYFKFEDIYSLEFFNYINNSNDNYKSSHFF